MLRGAIIGFGKIALQGHLPAYLDSRLASKVKIVAVVEPNPDFRHTAKTLLPDVHLFESIDDLFNGETPDFVDICTPPSLHSLVIESAATRGVHILCEKPFALTLSEAGHSRNILLKNKIIFMPCHQYRFSPIWKKFKETVDNADWNSKWLLQFNVYRTGADPGFLASNPNWRIDRNISGGGILADTGVHYIYLTQWILGLPFSISAITCNLQHREIKVEDTAAVVFLSKNGLTEITLTWSANKRANSARLIGHDTSLHYDGARLEKSTSAGCEVISVPDASDKTNYINLYISLIEEFTGRIERGENCRDKIDEAFRSIEILQACYDSSRKGQSVRIESESLLPSNIIAASQTGEAV
jgi:predicted dehydrogenase